MYQASEKLHAAILGDRRTFLSKIKIGSQEITSGIVSIRYTAYASESQLFSVGGTSSAYVEISMWDPSIGIDGKELEVSIGMNIDGATEYVPLGLFTAQKPSDDDGMLSFVAYDRIQSKMNGGYFSDLTYPTDAKNALAEISSRTGIPIDTSNLPNGIILDMKIQSTEQEVDENGNETEVVTYTEPFNGYTYRESLGYIAQLYNKYAIADRSGKIVFKWFAKSDGSIETSKVNQPLFYYDAASNMARTDAKYEVKDGYLVISDYVIYGNDVSEIYYENDYVIKKNRYYDDLVLDSPVFSVTGLVCQNESGTVISGSAFGNVEFANPAMTQSLLDNIYKSVNGIEFVPASVSFMGDVCLDICDVVEVVSKKGYNVSIPILGIVHDFDGGLLTSVYSYGASEDGSTSSSGPLAKSVERTYAELFFVKELVGKKASFEYVYSIDAEFKNVKADYAEFKSVTTESISATNAELESVKSDYGSFKQLVANEFVAIEGNFDTLGAKYATINLANIANGTITNAMIADATIQSAKIAGVSADKITAGTLDAELVNVINLNASSITVGTINGQQISDGAISIGKLTGSLSNTITSTESTANNALSSALLAQNAADAAASAASGAQTTANGKNTVFYQSSQPSTSGRKTNDVWFDTDDSNKMYYWSGSAWTARQFGTNAISEQSITNALIKDATIESAKIANIDAAKITSGIISANRLDVTGIFAKDVVATGTITGANIVGATGSFTGAIDATSLSAKDDIKVYSVDSSNYESVIKAKDWDNYYKTVLFGFTGSTDTFIQIEKSISSTGGHISIGGAYTDVYLNGYAQANSDLYVLGEISEGGQSLSSKYALASELENYLSLTGGTVAGTTIFSKTTDLSGTANNSPALIVGNPEGQHLEFDGNEIHSKSSGTTAGNLYINQDGGFVEICNAFFVGDLGTRTYPLAVNTSDSRVYAAGALYVGQSTVNSARSVRVMNDVTNTGLYITTTGNGGVYDWQHSKWLIYSNSSGTVTSTASDRRLKNDHGTDTVKESLTILRNVNPHKFTYKEDRQSIIQYGYIAQEMRDTLISSGIGYRPILQIEGTDGETYTDLTISEYQVRYGIDYSKMVPVLHDGWLCHDNRLFTIESTMSEIETGINEARLEIEDIRKSSIVDECRISELETALIALIKQVNNLEKTA